MMVESVQPEYEARIAGLCYLLVISGGVFSALFVREALFAPGDAASTARAIANNEGLWRWGIAVHLTSLYVPLVMIGEGGTLSALPEAHRQVWGHLRQEDRFFHLKIRG